MSSKQQNPQTGKQKVPQLKIEVFLEEPERTQSGLFLPVSALVTLDQKAEEDRAVQFFLDGLPYGQASKTDRNGRVTEKIRIPNDSKKVSVSVQVVGEAVSDRRVIDISQPPPETKSTPSSLRVEANGSNGEYILSVFVADKEGKPIKEIPVVLTSEDDLTSYKKIPTDENGVVVQSVTITSMERFILVKVDGIKIERIHLFGPISRPTEAVNERSLVLWQ